MLERTRNVDSSFIHTRMFRRLIHCSLTMYQSIEVQGLKRRGSISGESFLMNMQSVFSTQLYMTPSNKTYAWRRCRQHEYQALARSAKVSQTMRRRNVPSSIAPLSRASRVGREKSVVMFSQTALDVPIAGLIS